MNEKHIWDKLRSMGLTTAGTAALMGNLCAESALNPKNLQNSYEKKLGYSDESYTIAVDSGSYSNFIHDAAGYGLAQWTFWTRKQALLSFAREKKTSIGDLDMQLDFLVLELKQQYPAVWSILRTTDNICVASDAVMCQYERPADVSAAARAQRTRLGQNYADMFSKSGIRKHVVVSGDTLTRIAARYGTSVQAILQANQNRYPEMTADLICVGWVLYV